MAAKFTVQKLAENELNARINGKTALFLGGTKGIGLGLARQFARRGANITIAGRSGGDEVVKELKELSKAHKSVNEFIKADVSLVASSTNFARQFMESHKQLDYLVITVGILPDAVRTENEDGVERDFAVSCFSSRFVLLHEMLDYLNQCKTRVILLGVYGSGGSVNLDDMLQKKSYGAFKALGTVNVGNEMILQQLSKRNKGKGADFFGFTPGVVNSEAYRTWTGDTWKGWILDTLIGWFGKTVDSYVDTMVHTVVTDEIKGKSGLAFDNTGTTQVISPWLEEDNEKNSNRFYDECQALWKQIATK
jgi:NAD(P)-dependent dehydrogenase (short-subunit alcohol dehydrogenase family)